MEFSGLPPVLLGGNFSYPTHDFVMDGAPDCRGGAGRKQLQILRLTISGLKKAPGAPFAQDDGASEWFPCTASEEAFHELGIEFAGAEVGVSEDFLMQRHGSINSLHHELAEGALHFCDRFVSVYTVDDELGDE